MLTRTFAACTSRSRERRNSPLVLSPLAPQVQVQLKTTKYFDATRQRPDRAVIELAWIQFVLAKPEVERIQADGRIRRWAAIAECDGRWLRVVLLEDGETVHNAFFDRRFTP